MDKHPIEDFLERFNEVTEKYERAMKVNILLIDYIQDFHKAMTALSEEMGTKTEKLFKDIMEVECE